MKLFVTVGILIGAICCAEESISTNVVLETVSTNQSLVAATNDVPEQAVAVETNVAITATTSNGLPFILSSELFVAPESFQPVSDSLTVLFNSLQATEGGLAADCRAVLVGSLAEGQALRGADILRAHLARCAPDVRLDDERILGDVLVAVGCGKCLEAFRFSQASSDFWEWVFSSDERIRLVAGTLTAEDQGKEVVRILQTLYEHDPAQRDRFFNLILALAVVWDTPRLEMDDQFGNGWMPPDDDIRRYYDYFKNLYLSGESKVSYDELSVDSLIFVVDFPAPVSELEWVLANVDGSRALWGKRYQEITYDDTRIFWEEYDWPHREYSLQEIRECFGICVDQAYYSVMTARARGIPALFFRGRGKFGGHAWFGFMRKNDQWDLDVGRYSNQGYAIGHAIHSQSDLEMSDHELQYFCSRALQPVRSRNASALADFAALLYEEDLECAALRFAQKARMIDPLCEAAWETEFNVLVDTERLDDAVTLLKQKTGCFRAYSDVVADARRRQAACLSRLGRQEAAQSVLSLGVAVVKSARDDLQQELVLAQAEQLLTMGEGKKGLKAIERVLEEQQGEGQKLFPLIRKYKDYAERAGLKRQSEAFLKSWRLL